jgi:ribosomal protein S27E/flagellar basal body-associated protein FliL
MDLLDGIDFACPDCGHRSRYPLVHSGKSVACPSCKRNHVVPAPAPESALPVVPAPTVAKPAGETEKILFVCGSCHYRARIPGQYAGMAVRCPSCDAAQIANPDSSGGTTGSTVQLSKVPTAGHKTTIRAGNILFICSLCNFEAQLAKHYVGKAIRCPGCHAPQVVAGEAPAKDPAALERNATATGETVAPASDPRFICVGCAYRARIPSQYMGLAVTCPKCDTVQIATPEDQEGPSTGDTVSIARLKTAEEGAKIANPQVTTSSGFTSRTTAVKSTLSPAPTIVPGKNPAAVATTATTSSGDKNTEKTSDKVRFTCSACGFKARIPSAYAGENIHCPGCNAVQFVLRSGQLSPNATGNTQIIQIVQTAEAAASPDAIATPTHTPARGLPVIRDEPAVAKPIAAIAPPAPAIAKPMLPPVPPAIPAPRPVSQFSTPPPAVPVAQPAGTAAIEASIDDLLRFDDPSANEAPKPSGKVVRRGSDRLNAVSTKTPLPEESSKNAKTPLPEEPTKATVNDEIQADSQADAPVTVPVKSAPKFVPKAAPAVSAARPQPKADMAESAPAKSSSALVIVVAVIGLGLFALVGIGGWMVMGQLKEQKNTLDEQTKSLAEQTKTLADMQEKLNSAKVEIEATNKKLTKAEDETKLAKEAAETAAKKQAEEVVARKASEEKAIELEAKLKAAEEAAVKAAAEAKAASEKAASEKAANEKAAREKVAPVPAPR